MILGIFAKLPAGVQVGIGSVQCLVCASKEHTVELRRQIRKQAASCTHTIMGADTG